MPERCRLLRPVNAALKLTIVMEKARSSVSSTLLGLQNLDRKGTSALLLWDAGARGRHRGGRTTRLCPNIYTNSTLRLAGGSVKIIKTAPSLCVRSDDLTGMPSCPLEGEPRSTLAGVTLRQEEGCRDQGLRLHRRSVSPSAERLPDTLHMGESICAINGGNDFNVECL